MRSWTARSQRARWISYLLLGGAAAALVGPWLVLVLVGCGLIEAGVRSAPWQRPGSQPGAMLAPLAVGAAAVSGGLAALAWTAFKVGALSFGGGFVIIPLMQHDAVVADHWMTGSQFLGAVALGQLTPGPVVLTVAVVGYAAAGLAGGLLAAFIAFAPSFLFILFGAPHFGSLRASATVQGFLDGAGPAAIGGIAGASVPLGLALGHAWQVAVLVLAAVWLLVARRGVVSALSGAAGLGLLAVLLRWQ